MFQNLRYSPKRKEQKITLRNNASFILTLQFSGSCEYGSNISQGVRQTKQIVVSYTEAHAPFFVIRDCAICPKTLHAQQKSIIQFGENRAERVYSLFRPSVGIACTVYIYLLRDSFRNGGVVSRLSFCTGLSG